jgi:hypothetical protein
MAAMASHNNRERKQTMKIRFVLSTFLLLSLGYALTQPEGIFATRSGAVLEEAPRPSNRVGHCLIYDDTRRQVLLLSGYQPPNQPPFDEPWSWRGKRWERLAGTGPVARSLSAAVYDTRRKRVVLFGGVGNKGYEELKGDTWEWDGRSWQQMTDTSVGTRDHHVMAYDEARGKTVLYGGNNTDRSWAKDTWEWDGMKWAEHSVPGPGGRAHFAMVYDGKRKRVVLFGGLGEDRRSYNDTWEWDGQTWRKVSEDGPPPRARHRMAFDSRAGVIILYGGNGVKTEPGDGFRVLEDMWAWDGTRWTEIKTSGPGKRFMHALAYDKARGKTVLYGGGDGQKYLNDTWEWDGQRWTQRQ